MSVRSLAQSQPLPHISSAESSRPLTPELVEAIKLAMLTELFGSARWIPANIVREWRTMTEDEMRQLKKIVLLTDLKKDNAKLTEIFKKQRTS